MSRRRAVALAGIVAIVVTVVGACQAQPSVSASPPAASFAVPPFPTAAAGAVCELIADPQAAFGRAPISSPGAYSVNGNDRCTWVLFRDPSRHVGLTVGSRANHDATVTSFGAGEAVPNLGDEAQWWPGHRVLSVVVGDRSFQVDLELDAEDVKLETAVAAAKQVLASLAAS